jgi:hypothetical protein
MPMRRHFAADPRLSGPHRALALDLQPAVTLTSDQPPSENDDCRRYLRPTDDW